MLFLIPVLDNDSDIDGDELTVTEISTPEHGNIINNGNNITYIPGQNTTGKHSFNYRITDGLLLSEPVEIAVKINPINDAPVAMNDIVTANSTEIVVDVLANDYDAENNRLIISQVIQPALGSITNRGENIIYDPKPNFNGIDTFNYQITDGLLFSDFATVIVSFNTENNAPLAYDDQAAIFEDTQITISVLTNDLDAEGDTLRLSHVTMPEHGTLSVSNTDITYTPYENFYGEDTFIYTVTDNELISDPAIVAVSVIALNDVPIAEDDEAFTTEEVSVTIEVLRNST